MSQIQFFRKFFSSLSPSNVTSRVSKPFIDSSLKYTKYSSLYFSLHEWIPVLSVYTPLRLHLFHATQYHCVENHHLTTKQHVGFRTAITEKSCKSELFSFMWNKLILFHSNNTFRSCKEIYAWTSLNCSISVEGQLNKIIQ